MLREAGRVRLPRGHLHLDAETVIRLTGGTARSRVLPAPVPAGVRPTSSRAREALFNMLGNDLSGMSWLDLCAGTGLMALEAASRGASPVTVVDRDPVAIRAIERNADACGLVVRCIRGDARSVELPIADLVFLDPPYAEDVSTWLHLAAPRAAHTLVGEARVGVSWPELSGFDLDRSRVYGDTALALYVRVGTLSGGAEP